MCLKYPIFQVLLVKVRNKGTKSYHKVAQLRQGFVSKCSKGCFKMWQRKFFQSGAKIISNWGRYFTLGEN